MSRPTGWSDWQPFPDPRECDYLHAPFGPGVYELRLRNGQGVLFGIGGNVAQRFSSLLPAPLGSGTRNNSDKRDYVLKHLHYIEYRTMACQTTKDARAVEDTFKARKKIEPAAFVFWT